MSSEVLGNQILNQETNNDLHESFNNIIINNSLLPILINQDIWHKIYDNFINDYEKFDPDYEYESEYQLKTLFYEYKDCFTWFVLNCNKCFPIRMDILKSNLLKIISFLDEKNNHYHDYDLEHDVYGIIDYIIEEFRNYFRILTDEEYAEYQEFEELE